MNPSSLLRTSLPGFSAGVSLCAGFPVAAQLPAGSVGAGLADAPGEAIYAASCANCHGLDGRGLAPSLVAFEEELPDFTDCDFAAREPDADWIAVAHEGGPVRGFSEMMPAFRGALTEEQLGRVMEYIRTLCTDPNWPRGELNLPRALLTEKAYPEDEWVVEIGVDLEARGAAVAEYVYEQRFGPRSQIEVVIPYRWWRSGDDGQEGGEEPSAEGVGHGPGDLVLALKHALYHDLAAGTIVSVMGEVILPTGDHDGDPGPRGSEVEAFLALGRLLPGDAFLQAQAGAAVPLNADAASEGFGRILLGRTWTEGKWGRAWYPMLEAQVKRDFESGAGMRLDLVPQIQVSLNTRQHVLGNVGVLIPVGREDGERPPLRLLAYLLLDWFDGGFFEGW
ncbi:MAG: c-type cytochrome [Gemmatimonadota bacterium]|nr:c-type cytochrome [Gemmatimonadota bacterium]MDE2873117.1 c-type cytochrome [Gemmatimonadota bacterium]